MLGKSASISQGYWQYNGIIGSFTSRFQAQRLILIPMRVSSKATISDISKPEEEEVTIEGMEFHHLR
ncbi:hypothetical protein T4E_6618 [Trichinella pseudospiralis]|uniref:Uncharacterized protein n=1 Tax=Trichinella pseudospiralis TaxID=6337 RepID=A0A0V0XUU2_TRIPS|nr:hypothetical protein T4E_6618 [Trichinella pseudospiralis]